jgi:hypothetical protein
LTIHEPRLALLPNSLPVGPPRFESERSGLDGAEVDRAHDHLVLKHFQHAALFGTWAR